MTRLLCVFIAGFIASCGHNDAVNSAIDHQKKVNEADSRFEKLYKDLDRETK